MPSPNARTRERAKLTARHVEAARKLVASGRLEGRGHERADEQERGLVLRVGKQGGLVPQDGDPDGPPRRAWTFQSLRPGKRPNDPASTCARGGFRRRRTCGFEKWPTGAGCPTRTPGENKR